MSERIALSFGGGIQTVALVVLCLKDELPMPEKVIFADTGAEWPETYDYIARFIQPAIGDRFLVIKAPEGLYEHLLSRRLIPSPVRRQCTREAKLRPIYRALKELNIKHQWIGFSADEQGRAWRKLNSRYALTVKTSFPLIELGLTRADCEFEIQRYGWPLPRRSACYFCCFQHPNQVRRLFLEHPELFAQAEALENAALERAPGYFIMGNHPWRYWAVEQHNLFGDDFLYGCQDGLCFR